MQKQVFILTASARANSNSSAMAMAFARRAQEKGHEVKIINTITLAIKPCRGCGNCYKRGTPCVFDDDFTKVAPNIIAADVIVFAAPVYAYSFPAQMKVVLDKFITFEWGGVPWGVKQCALLTCAEESDPDHVFSGISISYDRMVEFLKWESLGKVMQAGVWDAGDITRTDALRAAEELAEKI